MHYDLSSFKAEVKKAGAPSTTILIAYGNGRGLSIFKSAFCLVTDRTRHNRTMRFYHVSSDDGRRLHEALSTHTNTFRFNDCDYILTDAFSSMRLEDIQTEFLNIEPNEDDFLSTRISQIESTSSRQEASIYDNYILHFHDHASLGDSLASVTLHIPGSRSDEPKPLRAKLCPICGDIFIHYDDYQLFTIQNGPPDFTLHEARNSRSDIYSIWKVDADIYSKLSLYGYDVRVDGLGLYDPLRQQYLVDLIEAHLISKEEIIKHLSFLVRMSKRNPVMKDYSRDWEMDLAYIRSSQP